MPPLTDFRGLKRNIFVFLQSRQNATPGLMQMRAVVKFARPNILFQVWHARRQLILRNVLQSKLLKSWRINDGGTRAL